MSGLFGGQNVSRNAPEVSSLRIPTSAYGRPIPLGWGAFRTSPFVLWYGDFKAIAHESDVGGKGGNAGGAVSYTYQASMVLGLCEGLLNEVTRVWLDKGANDDATTASRTQTRTESLYFGGAGSTASIAPPGTLGSIVTVEQGFDSGTNESGNSYGGYTVLSSPADYTRSGNVFTSTGTVTGQVSVTYTYTTTTTGSGSAALAGFSIFKGSYSQTAWSHLTTNHPTKALAYRGTAYAAALNMELGSNPTLPNLGFEVRTQHAYSASIPDANPRDVVVDAMTNPYYGAYFPANLLGDLTSYSDYCVASGIFISPDYQEQQEAGAVLERIAALTNSDWTQVNGTLVLVPYADKAVTGNGKTWTPNLTADYEIGPDDFVGGGSEGPIRRRRKDPAERYNQIRLKYRNRDFEYNQDVAEGKDEAEISRNGLRPAPQEVDCPEIKTKPIAERVVNLMVQRAVNVCLTYEFTLRDNRALIVPMATLLALTHPDYGLSQRLVRVVELEDNPDTGEIRVIAEEVPVGAATAITYPYENAAGFVVDYNIAPGNSAAPVIFEMPGQLAAETGIQLGVATRGVDANWGGCEVWTSLDGVTYKKASTLTGASRYGTTSSVFSSTVGVQGLGSAQLLSGSAQDASTLQTLCYVGGADPEFFAYQTATLTGAGAYMLAGLVRGAYNTAVKAHSSGDAFVRIDERVAYSEQLDVNTIGRTVYVKLLSFNTYGHATQTLAEVSAYTYTVTGRFREQPLSSAGLLNSDPLCLDLDAWTAVGGAANIYRTTSTQSGMVGTYYFGSSAGQENIIEDRRNIPASSVRTYSLTALARAAAGNTRHSYLYVRMFRADGSELTNADTGWGGTWAGYAFGAAVTPQDSWVRVGADFGAGTPRPVPASAAYMRIGYWMQYSGGPGASQVEQGFCDLQLLDVTIARAAATAATTASDNATTALGQLATIRSNGYIDAGEKPELMRKWQEIYNERAGLYDQGTNYGLTALRDVYQTAYAALSDYLGGLTPAWNNTTTDTPITPAVDQAKWSDYYAAKVALARGVETEAGKRAQWNLTTNRPANLAGLGGSESILNNEDSIIRAPGGGLLVTTDSVSGAIKIRLPQGFTNTMMRFFVDIFEYEAGYSCTLEIAGYTYAATSQWLNCTARVVGSSNVEYPVRFGHDGVRACVWIGERLTDTWAYPQVRIRDWLGGYTNFSAAQWSTGWSITVTAAAPSSISVEILDTLPGADWGKTARRPANVAALTGSEGIRNDLIGINAGGQLYGAGAGNGTVISNGQLSVTADGRLLNAGAAQGQITINGLGFTGALNATNDLVLIADANVVIEGNRITKINSGAWDGSVRSRDGYPCAFASCQFTSSGAAMLGLNTDPQLDSNWTSLDYAVYWAGDGSVYVAKDAALIGPLFAAGVGQQTDVWGLLYDGRVVYFFRNGVVFYRRAASVSVNLYLDTSLGHVGAQLSSVRFGPVSRNTGTNLLNPSQWRYGVSGSHGDFIQNPTSSGGTNAIGDSVLPSGTPGHVWYAVSGSAAGTNAEGGWDHTAMPVDVTKMYRFSTFVYISSATARSGSFYLGCGGGVVDSAGTTQANPYFVISPRASLPVDTWLLAVGYVHPASRGNGFGAAGGIYRCDTGELLGPGVAFRWGSAVTESAFRTYQFYTTAAGNVTFWAEPRMDICDGTEPTFAALMAMGAVSARNPITAGTATTYLSGRAIDNAQIKEGAVTVSSLGNVDVVGESVTWPDSAAPLMFNVPPDVYHDLAGVTAQIRVDLQIDALITSTTAECIVISASLVEIVGVDTFTRDSAVYSGAPMMAGGLVGKNGSGDSQRGVSIPMFLFYRALNATGGTRQFRVLVTAWATQGYSTVTPGATVGARTPRVFAKGNIDVQVSRV